MPAPELRPLDLGELLDRSVTLFVRHFGMLCGAVAVAYGPFAFVQWALIGEFVSRKPATFSRNEWGLFGLDLAIGMLVFTLSRTAVVIVARAAYMSTTISLGTAYRRAMARFAVQALALLFAAIITIVVFVVTVTPLFVVAVLAGVGGGQQGIIPILVTMALTGFIAAVLGAWLFLAFELATIRIATGAPNPYTALFSALGATAYRRPWHSLFVALTLLVVAVGSSVLFSSLTELIPSAPVRAFMTFGLGSVLSVLVEALSVTFLVAYDVDLAVRNEGLDLATALDTAPQAIS